MRKEQQSAMHDS